MSLLKNPLVTIVIPTYNTGHYLKSAIDSVLYQDYPNIELIVLDDGSTDDTQSILEGYRCRFFWEKHENIGQAETLNRGWRISRGEILSYLSADDTLKVNAVSTSVKYLLDNPEKILTYCDYELIDPFSRHIRKVKAPDYSFHDLVLKMTCQPGPGVFFWRYAYETIGGWNSAYRQMPDYEYWLRLSLLGDFYRIPRELASFRVHHASQSYARGHVGRALEPIRIIKNFFDRQDIPLYIKNSKLLALSNACLISARYHLRSGRSGYAYDMLRLSTIADRKNVFSTKSLRLILNAAFNRLAHRILWKTKGLLGRN